MSELFDDLFRRAAIRQHAQLLTWRRLRQTVGETSGLLAINRLAALLLTLDEHVEDRLQEVASRNRIRVRKVRYQCPSCGSSHCPEAMPVIMLPPNAQHMLQHLLAHGQPYTYEEEP